MKAFSGNVVQGDQTAYVAVAVGRTFTDIHVMEIKKMDMNMVKLDAAALGKNLNQKGYVILEGIYADKTGRAKNRRVVLVGR